ncbi:hypothetical protein JM18_004726 [Phytophthora kernoviae]|uniref:YqaJ viral recombinase domain-containing protein n=1 Tax=Phytophthora kernoviae TaxID=325452 RepID=A0A921V924_9STRA|nr:hypothetical protein JM18_004726 [Phytophthora kernoviae]
MATAQRRMGRNIMIFASEVPVVSALNPYRKIEDVFLDVWRRTNPRQVAKLQQELSVELLTPEEKLQTIEAAGIQQYEEKKKTVVKERNLVFSKRKVAKITDFDVLVGGKIDGRADGKVIEVKNRVKRFISPLPKYDIAQLQTYLFILGLTEGELVEHLHAEKMQTKMTKVPWDEKMWRKDVEPYLVRFGSALTYLMKDKQAQSDYLQSDGGQQREIIRYLWTQDVQRTE